MHLEVIRLINPSKVGNKSKHGWNNFEARLVFNNPQYHFMKNPFSSSYIVLSLFDLVVLWTLFVSFHYLVSFVSFLIPFILWSLFCHYVLIIRLVALVYSYINVIIFSLFDFHCFVIFLSFFDYFY